MLAPIEYRITCESPTCKPWGIRTPDARAWSVVLGHTVTEARKAARKAGWTRRKVDGRLADYCPGCSE